jgi:hypothetical protein
MNPVPTTVGLMVCEQVIEDRATSNVTVVSIFDVRYVSGFPSNPVSFSILCPLTNAEGRGTILLRIFRSDGMITEFERRYPVTFHSRTQTVRLHIRLNDVVFYVPGTYWVSVFVDDDFVVDRPIHVLEQDAIR